METGNINIYGKLVAQTGEGKVADTDQIFDKTLGKFQSEINGERDNYYTKEEIDNMVEAIKQFNIQIVNTLPEASESTMFIIYLIPSSNPKTTNSKDEYITVKSGNTYSWEQVGSTEIDLSGYSTTEEMNAAILSGLNNLSFLTGEKVVNLGADEEPTAGSENLVKSGGVHNELALGAVYDVSAKNPTAGLNNDGKFESLSVLLSDANLNTLIPTTVRKGGMSIKFVQSSDNNYVQYRLMSDTFNTTPTNWQGVVTELSHGSKDLAEVGGILSETQKHGLQVCSLSEAFSKEYVRAGKSITNGGGIVDYTAQTYIITHYYLIPKDCVSINYSGLVGGSIGLRARLCKKPDDVSDSMSLNLAKTGSGTINVSTYKLTYPYICIAVYRNADTSVTPDLSGISIKFASNDTQKIESTDNKSSVLSILSTQKQYPTSRTVYDSLIPIWGNEQANAMFNLFAAFKRGAMLVENDGVPPTNDEPSSYYRFSDYIAVESGHTYYYNLYTSSLNYIVCQYNSSKEFIDGVIGTNVVQKGFYTPEQGVAYVVLCSDTSIAYGAFFDVTNNLYAFAKDIEGQLKESDLELEVISNNLANPDNIHTGVIDVNGAIRDDVTTWKYIKIPVSASDGDVISFGGFYLGRGAFAAFYNQDTLIGSKLNFTDPAGTYNNSTVNIPIPNNATHLYIDILSPDSPANPYANLMVNYGSSLMTHDEYQEGVSGIDGYPIVGADKDIENRMSEAEEDINNLDERVSLLEVTNESLIADLPVSDGTGIQSGYAYIDSTDRSVKVKA